MTLASTPACNAEKKKGNEIGKWISFSIPCGAPHAETYRDAVEFKNGVKVRLQELEEGQSVEVLALSSEKTGMEDTIAMPQEIVQWQDSL